MRNNVFFADSLKMGNLMGSMNTTRNKDGDEVQYGYNHDGIFLSITKKDAMAAGDVAVDEVATDNVATDEASGSSGQQTIIQYHTGDKGNGEKIDMTEMHILLKEQGIPTMEIMQLRTSYMSAKGQMQGFVEGGT